MALEELIKAQIRARGPISLAEYMALALSHPEYGYYMRGDPFGAGGDFVTAPEISQLFGELIGAWLASQWLAMGSPADVVLAELGPGRGTLMKDALRATRGVPGFHAAMSVHLVETSPALRARQEELLDGAHPRMHWHRAFEALPARPLLLVANELFDALPIRQFVWQNQWYERMVGLDDDRLCFVISVRALLHGSPNSVIPACAGMTEPRQSIETNAVQSGDVWEVCPAGIALMQALAQHLATHGGAGLIVDYGYASGHGDTLQALKAHRFHKVPAQPGTADITAHVDFAALAQAAGQHGAAVHGPVGQGDFLRRLGAQARLERLCMGASDAQKSALISGLERLTSADQMGELFKVLCIAHPKHPPPEGF